MNKLTIFILACLLLMAPAACNRQDPAPRVFDLDYMSHIYPENFVSAINNQFNPLLPGSTFVYTGQTADGTERVEVEVLEETRTVMGIVCTVVRDRAYLNDEIHEDTYDWFAQDRDGNVWYFGEDVDNYVNGAVDNHFGSWEAGVDGAEPGIVMLGNPVAGLKYRQEHYLGQAEDQGEVVGKNERVTVPAGAFAGCLKIRETNPLDPDFLEFKYYAKGVGLVKVEVVDTEVETEELTSYSIK